MEALASALGMSKKTLYVHFPSKDAIVLAVVHATGRTIRREAEAAMAEPSSDFSRTLRSVVGVVSAHLAGLTSDFLDDLERAAPHVARELDALKERNIPIVFNRLLQIGIASGKVRRDVDVPLVVEVLIHVMKGLHQPESLKRSGLTGKGAFEGTLDLLLTGLLSLDGRVEYVPFAPRRHGP